MLSSHKWHREINTDFYKVKNSEYRNKVRFTGEPVFLHASVLITPAPEVFLGFFSLLTLCSNILHNLNGFIKLSGLHLNWVGSYFYLLGYEIKSSVGTVCITDGDSIFVRNIQSLL